MISLLKNKTFRLTWVSQTTFQMATSFVEFTLIYLVGCYISSESAVSFVLFGYKFPSLVMTVVSGFLCDRYDRRLILLWATLVRAVGAFITLLFIDRLGSLVTFALVFSLAGHLFKTAEGALLPEIVEEDDLMSAAGLFNMTEHGTTLLGIVTTIPLLELLRDSSGWSHSEALVTLGIAAVLFSTAAMILSRLVKLPVKLHGQKSIKLKTSNGEVAEKPAEIWRKMKSDMAHGIRYIKSCPVCIKMILHLVLVNTIILIVMGIGIPFAKVYLGVAEGDMFRVGLYVILPVMVGFLSAIVLLPFLQKRIERQVMITTAVTTAGTLFLGMGAIKYFFPQFGMTGIPKWYVYVGLYLVGFCVVCALVPAFVTLQAETENKLRGRAFGILFSAITAFSAIPLLGLGPLLDRIGVVPILLASGIFIVAYSGILIARTERQRETRVGASVENLREP